MIIIKIEEITIIIVDGIILVMGIFMGIIMEIIEEEILIIGKELITKNILLEVKGEIIVRVLNQVHLQEVGEVNQGLITLEVKAEVQDLCHLLV